MRRSWQRCGSSTTRLWPPSGGVQRMLLRRHWRATVRRSRPWLLSTRSRWVGEGDWVTTSV